VYESELDQDLTSLGEGGASDWPMGMFAKIIHLKFSRIVETYRFHVLLHADLITRLFGYLMDTSNLSEVHKAHLTSANYSRIMKYEMFGCKKKKKEKKAYLENEDTCFLSQEMKGERIISSSKKEMNFLFQDIKNYEINLRNQRNSH
ncbi:hypothetical protein NPIL_621031, partial [Nephila pilipes]